MGGGPRSERRSRRGADHAADEWITDTEVNAGPQVLGAEEDPGRTRDHLSDCLPPISNKRRIPGPLPAFWCCVTTPSSNNYFSKCFTYFQVTSTGAWLPCASPSSVTSLRPSAWDPGSPRSDPSGCTPRHTSQPSWLCVSQVCHVPCMGSKGRVLETGQGVDPRVNQGVDL